MLVTAVVCSVNRPSELRRSLQALKDQERVPDAIVVVAQVTDVETIRVATECGARVVRVNAPGLALALQTAIASVATGVVAFVDDDARARPDWARRIEDAFVGNPALGAVGGRDNVDGDDVSGDAGLQVGVVTRTGRIVGNHHLGKGVNRPASTVKGANMAVRAEAAHGLPLSTLVRGSGAQYRNELILTAMVRRRGYSVSYDPRIQVDHFPATRLDGDERQLFSPTRVELNVTNEVIGLSLGESTWVRVAYLARMAAVGTRLHPGLAHLLLGSARRSPGIGARTRGTWRALSQTPALSRLARETLSRGLAPEQERTDHKP